MCNSLTMTTWISLLSSFLAVLAKRTGGIRCRPKACRPSNRCLALSLHNLRLIVTLFHFDVRDPSLTSLIMREDPSHPTGLFNNHPHPRLYRFCDLDGLRSPPSRLLYNMLLWSVPMRNQYCVDECQPIPQNHWTSPLRLVFLAKETASRNVLLT